MNNLISKYSELLPAAAIASKVNNQLARGGCLVVTAPPGAGKSTLLPLSMLQALRDGTFGPDTDARILMLEPRRLAARQIAVRMAQMLGEEVGQTVGYRVRHDTKVSQRTRIEVLTEGILTRMIIDDPTLADTQIIIFDEFHERSLNADLALALSRITRQIIRPDLRLVLMSATIDATSLCQSLGADLIESQGRMYHVSIEYAPVEPQLSELTDVVCASVRHALKAHDGDILVFLPGEREIREAYERLNREATVYCLYGNLSPEQQHLAIAPSSPGTRKVVLSTNIAETSLTIEGVRVVIDSGYMRQMVFSQQNGLSRLETVRISQDMADQRAGRAGRLSEGHCYRLWTLATHQRLAPNRTPEILEADLSPALLSVAAWGEERFENLPWLTAPLPAHTAAARKLLSALGAITDKGEITTHGRKMASEPCHPRIAQIMVSATSRDERDMALAIADLLEQRDPLARREPYSADVRLRVKERDSARLSVGQMLALAFPERVAKALSEGNGRFLLASGDIAQVDISDELSAYEWLAVASLNNASGRIFLAAPITADDARKMARERSVVSWDTRSNSLVAQTEWRIGQILVKTQPARNLTLLHDEIHRAVCDAARRDGLSMFDFADSDLQNLQRRIAAVDVWHPELDLPDCTIEALLASPELWLPNPLPSLDLKKFPLADAVWDLLTWSQQQAIDRLAPTHIQVPTGSRIRLEYRQGAELPILRVRLQECFGMTETPRLNDGRCPILLELLSPGFKPVQLTQDLHSFWQNTYFEVRKELRRRYPKHSWPDNPLEAEPTRRTKPH